MATTVATRQARLATFMVVLAVSVTGAWSSKSFVITNNCAYTVWPGILSGAGSAGLNTTGFELAPGQSRTLSAPSGWSGRLWGRTLCSTAGNKFACVTGDCGSGRVDCGDGAAPPATLVEFTLDGSGGMDFYDVSLVDGYNLPVLVVPRAPATAPAAAGDGGGNCAPTGCAADLNAACPADLRVTAASPSSGDGAAVACKSACEAFGSPQYCCSREYGTPAACKPTSYSRFFKDDACPQAYSYAYDDATSTFTCAGSGTPSYAITFCPAGNSSASSVKSSTTTPGLPLINSIKWCFGGGHYFSAAGASRPPPLLLLGIALVAFTRAFY